MRLRLYSFKLALSKSRFLAAGPATEAGTPAASFGEAKRAGVADGSAAGRSLRPAAPPARQSRVPGRAPFARPPRPDPRRGGRPGRQPSGQPGPAPRPWASGFSPRDPEPRRGTGGRRGLGSASTSLGIRPERVPSRRDESRDSASPAKPKRGKRMILLCPKAVWQRVASHSVSGTSTFRAGTVFRRRRNERGVSSSERTARWAVRSDAANRMRAKPAARLVRSAHVLVFDKAE